MLGMPQGQRLLRRECTESGYWLFPQAVEGNLTGIFASHSGLRYESMILGSWGLIGDTGHSVDVRLVVLAHCCGIPFPCACSAEDGLD